MRARKKKRLSGGLDKISEQPVAVLLHDGSYYIGWITESNEKTLTIAGHKGPGKIKKAPLHPEKVKISAFLPGFPNFNAASPQGWPGPFGFSPVSQAPAAGGGTGFGGFMGLMKQVMPGIRMGWNIVRTVMPLMSKLRL